MITIPQATACHHHSRPRSTSHAPDGQRTIHGFRVVLHDLPDGDCAAYFPEANPLVPLSSTAIDSNTPTSKSVPVTVAPAAD